MKTLIKVIAFCYCFILFPATSNVQFFPTEKEEPRLITFKHMCEKLAPIVKGHSGMVHTCFITYAWPPSLHDPINSWIEAIRSFLSIAGIEVYFDKEDFGGSTADLEQKCKNALKNIVLLTPDLKIKHDELKTQLVQEIGIVFKKSTDARKLILLSSQVNACLPNKKYLGGYVSGTELIHMMTPSDFRDQKETDVPCIDRFFSVMCSLLDPKNTWGLLSNIISGFEETCHQHIQQFLTDSKISSSKGFQLNRTISLETQRLNIPKAREPNRIVSYLPRFTCFLESGSETEAGSYFQRVIDYFHQNETSFKKRLMTTHDKRFSVLGMGGIGKTTLALKYAYDAREQQWYDIVYWIPSETKSNFIEGYRKLLGKIDKSLMLETLSDEDVIRLLLEKIIPFKTLLILDNVPPSYEEGGEHAENYLSPILPTGNNAHILMTSRETNWSCTKLDLSSFSINEAIDYLLERTGFDDKDNASLLAEELGCLPLALSYAAAYMKEKHISLKNYFDLYRTSLQKVLSFHPRVEAYPHTIASTFDVSLSMLDEKSREVLSRFCYLDPDKIYVDVIKCDNQDNLMEILEKLESLSLIKWDWKEKTVSLHRLLQVVFREKILPDIKKNIDDIKNGFCGFLDPYYLSSQDAYYNGRESFEEQIDGISIIEKMRILEIINYIERQIKILNTYPLPIDKDSDPFLSYLPYEPLESIDQIRTDILKSILKQHQNIEECDKLIQENINIEEKKFNELTQFLNDNKVYIMDSMGRKILYEFLKDTHQETRLKENFKEFRKKEIREFSAREIINVFILCELISNDNFSGIISRYLEAISLNSSLKGGHLLWVINTFSRNDISLIGAIAELLITHIEPFKSIKDYEKITEKIKELFLSNDIKFINDYNFILKKFCSVLQLKELFNAHDFLSLLNAFQIIPLDKWDDFLIFYKQEKLETKNCGLITTLEFFEKFYPLFGLKERFSFDALFCKADEVLEKIPTYYSPDEVSYFGEYDRYYMAVALSQIDSMMWDKAVQRMMDYMDRGNYGDLAKSIGYESRTVHEIVEFISVSSTIQDDDEWNSGFNKSKFFTYGLTGFDIRKYYPIVLSKTKEDLEEIEELACKIHTFLQKNGSVPDYFFHLNLLEIFKNADKNMVRNVRKKLSGKKIGIDNMFLEIESALEELKELQ